MVLISFESLGCFAHARNDDAEVSNYELDTTQHKKRGLHGINTNSLLLTPPRFT